MKSNNFLISVLIGVITCLSVNGQTRTTINLNDQWKFKLKNEVGAEKPGFDDTSWDNIKLPHTWNNMDGQDGHGYKREIGWYRKKISIPASYQGRRLFFRFGAANLVASVYINGNLIDTHRGGYAAFIYDITSKVSYNAVNTIAVKVDNSNTDKIAPLHADFTFCGGLTRPVELLITDPVTISLTDYASPGIYISQNSVSKASAAISVKVLINNYSSTARTINKTINIKDSRNNIVTSNNEQLSLSANSLTSKSNSFTINNPVLWNGRINPYLYKVEVILKENNIIKDSLSQPLGLRYYEIRRDSGFYLNGKRYPLYGVNHHEDRLNKGRAITDADRLEDMNMLAELGVTFIRLSHYQHDEYTYDLADKNGIILWTEIPLIDSIANTPTFSTNIKEQLKELMRQNYNHPSVFFWGLYNEILNKPGPDPLQLVTELNSLAHQEDATRPTAVASNKDDKAVNVVADLVSFNKYYTWYFGTINDFDNWLLRIYKTPLAVPVGLSEYGAGGSIKQHELNPVRQFERTNWHPEEFLNIFHENYWKSIEKYPFLWQTSAWVSFDFSSDGRNEGDKAGINDKGLITHDHKTKKDAFYFYKANWSKEPVLYITSRRFSERTDPITYVKVYSNCDSALLTVNRTANGFKKSINKVILWENVILDPGVNIVKVTGYKKGVLYSDSCIWRYDALKAEKTIRVNFQTTTTQTPDGYLADAGAVYNERGNGYTYGWHVDNTTNAREKNLWSDKLYDAFNHFQKNSPDNYWEIALKNGSYFVHLASGDPGAYDSNFKILAEGKLILNGIPSKEKPWIINGDTITVKDGKLTVRAATDAVNTKINFIHITRVDSTNIGLGKKVTQSSTSGGNAERAIDGNTDGNYNNGSVTHTNNESNAWWEMDLGSSYQIGTLQIWNRTDCCSDRLSNYYLFTSDVPFQSKDLNTTISQTGVWNSFNSAFPNPSKTFVFNRTARYIRIQRKGTGVLHLAEVIIMGKLKFPPTAPSGLKATFVSPAINLNWNDNSNNEQGFTIERKQGSSNYVLINNISEGIKTYTDSKDLKPGTTYTYRVKAFNAEGASGYSNEFSVTTSSVPLVENLALHKSVTQTSTAYGGVPERAVDGNTDGLFSHGSVTHTSSKLNAWWEVDLGNVYSLKTIELWNRTDNCCKIRLTNYYVFVSDVPFQSKELTATLNQQGVWNVFRADYPNPSQIFDVNRTGRYVRVQLKGTGELNIAEVLVMGTPKASITAPSGLMAVYSASGINLSWIDNSNNELGFKIERKYGSANYEQIVSESQNIRTYTDSDNLLPETEYTYRVFAFNNDGYYTFNF